MVFDEIDRKIISILREDGRASYKKLGDALGFTLMGAKRRVEKILDEDLVKICALENVDALGYQAALILLEIDNRRSLKRILDRFERCPRVVNFFTLLSGYNLAALVIAEDIDTLESESLERCSLRSQEGIRRSEFYPIGEIHYSAFLAVREELFGGLDVEAPCGVNCGECPRYEEDRCLGCPATKFYRH
jgi:DNA-binding Lrp family transcriptional regulator